MLALSLSMQECFDAGMTAAECALVRDCSVQSAYRWASQRRLRWPLKSGGGTGVCWAQLEAARARRRVLREAQAARAQDRGGPYSAPREDDCRALWAAVLLEMWRCATASDAELALAGRCGSGMDRLPLDQARARSWFGSRDFHIVCAFVGMDGYAVLRAYEAGARPGGKVRGGVRMTGKGRAA